MPCKQCKCLTHRKCVLMNSDDINTLNIKVYTCTKCNEDNLPYVNVNNDILINDSFNSNFNCKCQNQSKCHHVPMSNNILGKLLKISELNFNKNSKQYDHDPDAGIPNPTNFAYYTNHDIHKLKKENNSIQIQFSILHTNISSLNGNGDKLELLLDDIDYKFDVVALTETWNPETNKHTFSPKILEDYEPYEGIPGSSLKGGCGVYINEYLCTIPRYDLNIRYKDKHSEFECKWIEVININSTNTIIGIIYRHPRNSDLKFTSNLKNPLKTVSNEKKMTLLVGDFNYDLLKHEKKKNIYDFLMVITSNLFTPHILGPTRIEEGQTPSLVDNIFVNTTDNNFISVNLFNKISDHMPNFIIIQDIDSQYSIKAKQYKRDMKNFNEKRLLR